jgi:hypothetical protein
VAVVEALSILLNWRVWLIAGLAAAGIYSHHLGYVSGKEEVQSVFDAYKLQTIEQAMTEQVLRQAKESAMSAANAKVSADYVSLQVATNTAVLALDRDRMRLQAALAAYRSATGSDPKAGQSIDGDAIVQSFSECIDRYSTVARSFDETSDTLKALQDYVNKVVR